MISDHWWRSQPIWALPLRSPRQWASLQPRPPIILHLPPSPMTAVRTSAACRSQRAWGWPAFWSVSGTLKTPGMVSLPVPQLSLLPNPPGGRPAPALWSALLSGRLTGLMGCQTTGRTRRVAPRPHQDPSLSRTWCLRCPGQGVAVAPLPVTACDWSWSAPTAACVSPQMPGSVLIPAPDTSTATTRLAPHRTALALHQRALTV